MGFTISPHIGKVHFPPISEVKGWLAGRVFPAERPLGDLCQAAKRLADEANLICLPGEVFGPGLEGYLRLAFGNIDEEAVPAAVERFRSFAP